MGCRYPDSCSLLLLRAALLAREGKLQEAAAILEASTAQQTAALQLSRAQLALQSADTAKVQPNALSTVKGGEDVCVQNHLTSEALCRRLQC